MRIFSWGNLLFLFALLAVIYGLLKIFDAERHLGEINLFLVLVSAIIYILGIGFWNYAWGNYFGMDSRDSIRYGFASQIGGLTPFSLGADYLRGLFAKVSGKRFIQGIAASLAAKFHKILIALVFSALGIGALLVQQSHLRGSLLLGVLIPILMLGGAYFLTRNYAPALISGVSLKRVKKADAREFSINLKKYLKKPKAENLAVLFLSLACEFISFYLAFLALNIPFDFLSGYLVFILLFFSSKAFFVPQGIGITELIGLYVLGGSIQVSLVAAALLIWNIIRIWIPTIVAGAAVLFYGKRLRWK